MPYRYPYISFDVLPDKTPAIFRIVFRIKYLLISQTKNQAKT